MLKAVFSMVRDVVSSNHRSGESSASVANSRDRTVSLLAQEQIPPLYEEGDHSPVDNNSSNDSGYRESIPKYNDGRPKYNKEGIEIAYLRQHDQIKIKEGSPAIVVKESDSLKLPLPLKTKETKKVWEEYQKQRTPQELKQMEMQWKQQQANAAGGEKLKTTYYEESKQLSSIE